MAFLRNAVSLKVQFLHRMLWVVRNGDVICDVPRATELYKRERHTPCLCGGRSTSARNLLSDPTITVQYDTWAAPRPGNDTWATQRCQAYTATLQSL